MRRLLGAALLLATAAGPLRAQGADLQRADSAFAARDFATAERLYQAALARDSSQSRAVYRLGQLAPSQAEAYRWFRRYTELEPQDPWGYMAVGNARSRQGDLGAALAWYDRAARLAPEERDVALGRFRALSRAERRERAARVLEDWLAAHPGDGEAWELLGREWLRAGRPSRATSALMRAQSLGHDVSDRLRAAWAADAVAVEPLAGYERDSDGNRTSRFGLRADLPVGDGTRLGAAGRRLEIGDGFNTAPGFAGLIFLSARPHSSTRLQLAGGAIRLDPDSGEAWNTVTGEARLRWRAPERGPSLELRGQRLALGTSPLLVVNQVVRTEGRGALEIPLGPVRLRGGGRFGAIEALGERNTRWGADGALVIPIGWQGELSAQYHRLGYADPTAAGYFAPRLVETVEAGSYVELGDDGPLLLALDLGAGLQRTAEHGAGVGPWKLALRAWGYLLVPLAPGRAIGIELEAYRAPFSPEGAPVSETWRFGSASAGLRWAL